MGQVRTADRFDAEDRREHLRMIQAVIARMASNSFLLKGWSVTLAAALIAIGAKEAALAIAITAAGPVVAFWALDGYYLLQERRYRALVARAVEGAIPAYSMDASRAEKRRMETAVDVMTSGTVLAFHLPVLLAVVAAIVCIYATKF
jgi:hypothetical protein